MSWARLDDWGFDAFDKLAVIDYGDCEFDFGFPETIPSDIREHTTDIISEGVGLLSLGGDHFITWPILQAHAEKYGPLSINPLRRPFGYLEDEEDRVDHGTMFYHAAKQGVIDAALSYR